MALSKAISYYRDRAGLSQAELAGKIPCDQSAIAKYEAGVREPSASVLLALAQALECTPNDLLQFDK